MNFNGYPNLQAVLCECKRSYMHSDKEPRFLGNAAVWKNMHTIWKGFSPEELSRIEEDLAALRADGTYKRGYYVTREALILTATEDWKMSFYPIRCRDIIWIYAGSTTHSVNFIPTSKTYNLYVIDAYCTKIQFCKKSSTAFNKKNLMEEDLKYLMGELLAKWPGIMWGYSAEVDAIYRKDFSALVGIVRRKNEAGVRKEDVRARLEEKAAEARVQDQEPADGVNAGTGGQSQPTEFRDAGAGDPGASQSSRNTAVGDRSTGQNSWNADSGDRSTGQNPWNTGSGNQSAERNPWNTGSGNQSAERNLWNTGSGNQSAERNPWNGGSGDRSAERNPWNGGSGDRSTGQNPWNTGTGDQSAGQSSRNTGTDYPGSTVQENNGNGANTDALVLRSPDQTYTFLIKQSQYLLGRGIDVDGRIGGNPNIGRKHCMILRRKDGKYYIRDLQSLNGTFLNGRRLDPNVDCRLKNGDEIMLYSQKLIVSIENGRK